MTEEVKKVTRVLIGVDDSENCLRAFNYYVQHIHKSDNEVILFHVSDQVKVPTYALLSEGMALTPDDIRFRVESLRKKNKELDEKYDIKCRELQIKHKFLLATEDNHGAGHAIVDAAKKHHAHLIVVGSRGLGALKRTIMGSISSYVIHHGHIPALLTQDEDYFMKDLPESILPPSRPEPEKSRPSDDGEAGSNARGDSNLSDDQIKELKHYRDVVKTMGRELSNLQSTVAKLKQENESLQKTSPSENQLMSVIFNDPTVEVDSQDDFVERYVALKAKLEADLAEFKKYKDKVQTLQNQLIKANDREKKILSHEVTEGNNPRISKPANKERQKARKLENTVKQQENVIKNLEKSLRDYLDRAEQARSVVSAGDDGTSTVFENHDSKRDEIVRLMEQNAKLREDIGDWRALMHQDEMKNVQLNDDLVTFQQRIESLEAQLGQNAQTWACEKRELNVRCFSRQM